MNKHIKKKLAGFLVTLFCLIGLAPIQAVHALPPETDITGVITDSGSLVGSASVDVECEGMTKNDMTNSTGAYLVSFTFDECPPASTVHVTAPKGPKSGSKSGTVMGLTTKLNVGIVNVDIPEYGLIGGVIATSAGIGAVIFTRRRYAGQGMSL